MAASEMESAITTQPSEVTPAISKQPAGGGGNLGDQDGSAEPEPENKGPPCLACCPCLQCTVKWCLEFWFNKQTPQFWVKILLFEMLEWSLLSFNVFVLYPEARWAVGFAITALIIDIASMPCLFIVYKDPHSESSHGLKFVVFFAEHLSDVFGILALVETQRWDAKFASPECVYQNAWFQWNVVFICFRLYMLCTRTALEELAEACTSHKKTQCTLKAIVVVGLIAAGVVTSLIALTVDFGTCDRKEKDEFGVIRTMGRGAWLLGINSDVVKLKVAYGITFVFTFGYVIVLVFGRMILEMKYGYNFEGRPWNELHPWHKTHDKARAELDDVLARGSETVESIHRAAAELMPPIDIEIPNISAPKPSVLLRQFDHLTQQVSAGVSAGMSRQSSVSSGLGNGGSSDGSDGATGTTGEATPGQAERGVSARQPSTEANGEGGPAPPCSESKPAEDPSYCICS